MYQKCCVSPQIDGSYPNPVLSATFEKGPAEVSVCESLSARHIIAPINIITAWCLKAIMCFTKHVCGLLACSICIFFTFKCSLSYVSKGLQTLEDVRMR